MSQGPFAQDDFRGSAGSGLTYAFHALRPNGMRRDLMEKLKALNPSYLRIPGGNNM